MNNIGAVVSYCTNEEVFLAPCLRALRFFCDQIVISCGDALYDGTPEDQTRLEAARRKHRDVQFVNFHYDPQFKTLGTMFWGGFQRAAGLEALRSSIEYVLLVDVDEIIESKLFVQLLRESNYRDYTLMTLVAYWYFGSTSCRATTMEQGPSLVRKGALHPGWLVTPMDRAALLSVIPDPKLTNVTYGDRPMVHHYSWVRSREEMLRKVRAWGHNRDRDWEKLVEEYFARPEAERSEPGFRDFVHGYTYETVAPYITL
jgi:hypothetical protein